MHWRSRGSSCRAAPRTAASTAAASAAAGAAAAAGGPQEPVTKPLLIPRCFPLTGSCAPWRKGADFFQTRAFAFRQFVVEQLCSQQRSILAPLTGAASSLQGGWEAQAAEPSAPFAEGDGWDTGSQLPGGSVSLGLPGDASFGGGEGLAAFAGASEVQSDGLWSFACFMKSLADVSEAPGPHSERSFSIPHHVNSCTRLEVVHFVQRSQPRLHACSCREWMPAAAAALAAGSGWRGRQHGRRCRHPSPGATSGLALSR